MNADKLQPAIVEKEMGLTHKEFYDGLPALLGDLPYRKSEEGIRFQLDGKTIEIHLGRERSRQLGLSVNLPVTPVTLRFYDFSAEERDRFIQHFNLKYMKGGG